ncbi:MAG: stage II sporulation protein D [Oscillospiraceae bacterium]|nr:stage II sporulation protein D [Oscillospiraceae bacterium]
MRHSIQAVLVVILFWVLLALLALPARKTGALPAPTETELRPLSTASAADQAAAAEPLSGFDEAYRLPVLADGQVVRMDLHRYLTGALLAEMPLSFSEEALKAQAVACRTYALRSCLHRRHPEAAVCTDSGCCQGWLDPDRADPANRARAEAMVRATDGLAIYYQGALIDATFFSCSGGQTEAAAAVWGSDLPYLQAVQSPGEENAAHFSDEFRVPLADFRAALEELDPEICLDGPPESWVGGLTETPGGGVDEIILGGRPFRGKLLRKRFGLRSTAFTLELNGEEAVFRTRGYGHRVGMSQYGAEAMARAGNDFMTILKWYYTGVEIEPAK